MFVWRRIGAFGTKRRPIKLGRCPGWSESLVGAQVILLVLSGFISVVPGNEKKFRSISVMPVCCHMFSLLILIASWFFRCTNSDSHNGNTPILYTADTNKGQLMRLWHFLSSVDSFFKHACTAIQWGWRPDFWLDPSSTYICHVFEQQRLWLVAYIISTIISWTGSDGLFYEKMLRPVYWKIPITSVFMML